ncbi:hypothetical protein CMT48_17055 [Elizabethkingia anophelis]|nr:hypothetical protein [Elizabethkingia anophelis]
MNDEELRLIIFLSYMDYFREHGPIPMNGTVSKLSTQAFNYIKYGNIEGRKEPENTQNQKPFNLLSLLFWNH